MTIHPMLIDKALDGHRTSFLSASDAAGAVLSPYFQRSSLQKVGTDRDIHSSLVYMAVNRAIVRDIEDGGSGQFIAVCAFLDSSGSTVEVNIAFFSTAAIVDNASYINAAETAVNAYAAGKSYVLSGGIIWSSVSEARVSALIAAAIPAAAASYQTIVSQTGTAAPAVSGSLVPINTYPGAPTFTWARTGAGVYTLTASSAVFNTSGKTAVLLGSLNNLNAQWKAVVTSTTVITFTTAVQSLAVLGLLGFTATNTDALLAQTEVQVLTYS